MGTGSGCGALKKGAAALGFAVLFFVALQVGLDLAFERGLPELRDPEYAVKLTRLRQRLADKPGRPLVLALGSSRVLLGFRPDVLPPCRTPDGRAAVVFNCSFLGAGPLLELVCLRRLLADGIRPDVVLVECWPPTETVERVALPPVGRLSGEDLIVWERFADDPRGLRRQWAESRLLPCYTDRLQIQEVVTPRWEPRSRHNYLHTDDNGWKPCPFGQTADERQGLARLARRSYEELAAGYRHSRAAERERRELLLLCRREGIRAALVFFPEGSTFRGWYSPEARADAQAFFARLGRDFEVPVIDARTWAPDDAFADYYHLLPEGAAAFTRRFGHDVLRPLLEGRPPASGGPGR